jgi:hypothetical protein
MSKERPILFSAPMVRAILDGSKTQTRRAINNVHEVPGVGPFLNAGPKGLKRLLEGPNDDVSKWPKWCPHGIVGDHLWVRETWQTHCDKDGITPRDLPPDTAVQYPATYDHWVSKKRPGIHMPRWASRITLTVTYVRVQRLQEITEEDAKAEGAIRMQMDDDGKFYQSDGGTYRCGFSGLWAHINGADSWDADPWVWAISFRLDQRKDA